MKLKYRIVHGSGMSDLEYNVKQALDAGWELQGGVAVSIEDGGYRDYYQAVIRRDDPQPSPGDAE